MARIGGEEFLAVLPDADGVRAREIGERIRQHVSSHGWTSPTAGLVVTLSVGLAGTPPCEKTALAQRADPALCWAQALGRDRVETG